MKIEGQAIECAKGWQAELNFRFHGVAWTAYTNTFKADANVAMRDAVILAELLGGEIDWITADTETPQDD